MKNKIIKICIEIQKNVKFDIISKNVIKVTGILGYIKYRINNILDIKINNNKLYIVNNTKHSTLNIKSLINTTISVINNLIIGVTIGYTKELILFGIGYKSEIKNEYLKLSLGYSHDIFYKIPKFIKVICKDNTKITIFGIDKQLVGQVSSEIRKFKIPDPYKGKGIRYLNENIILKEVKKVK